MLATLMFFPKTKCFGTCFIAITINFSIMNSTLKLQLDVKNNAQDLQNYMLDLNNWEEEMKLKEKALNNEKTQEDIIPPPRNKIKRSKPQNEKKSSVKPKKISAYDYSAWDKFDVDKACAEVDEEDVKEKSQEDETEEIIRDGANDDVKSDCTDSDKLSLIDEAFYEKEMGNQFVKKEQWTEAIKCYTKAISLDSHNAIYYANRSLCFLKLKNLKCAETDATTAIQLDKKYVKAYQRRAFARLALGQLVEAKSDYEEILKLEPKNALARYEISRIEEKLKEKKVVLKDGKKTFNPKQMFKQGSGKPKPEKSVDSFNKQSPATKLIDSSESKTVSFEPASHSKKSDTMSKTENTVYKKNLSLEKEVKDSEKGDGDKTVPSSSAKPKSEIFKPLPEWCKLIHPVNIPPHKRSKKPLKRINIEVVDKDEDLFEEEEKTKSECVHPCDNKEKKVMLSNSNEDEDLRNERLSFDVPKTAIQFRNCWKALKKNPEKCYSYIKKIQGGELPRIFENSLESDFFSELVTFLADDEIKKEPEVIYDFLLGLTKVKRFSSLSLFMSEVDKKCVKKSVAELEKIKTKEEINELLRLYELKI